MAPNIFSFHTEVKPEWIDYNGHMNDATYSLVVTLGNEKFIDQLGMGKNYLTSTGRTLYTVELNLKYLAEVKLEDKLNIEMQIVSITSKSFVVQSRVFSNGEKLAAEATLTYLHYDQNEKRVIDFNETQVSILSEHLIK